MNIRKLFIYIRRYIDFLALDVLAFSLAYYATVLIRRTLNIPIYHGELFLGFGIAAIVIFVIVDIVSQNLNGVLTRSFPAEVRAVAIQMLLTWSIYTVFLYMLKEAHEFSRSIYVMALLLCSAFLLITRSIWKGVVRYTKLGNRLSGKILIVCEKSESEEVLKRLLPASFENKYEIVGIVTNTKGESDYRDFYPLKEGFSNIPEMAADQHVRAAYVELQDAAEEAEAIRTLLDAGVIVHRSLGDSSFNYAGQFIGDFGGKSVITINNTRVSLVRKADELIERIKRKRAEKREEE